MKKTTLLFLMLFCTSFTIVSNKENKGKERVYEGIYRPGGSQPILLGTASSSTHSRKSSFNSLRYTLQSFIKTQFTQFPLARDLAYSSLIAIATVTTIATCYAGVSAVNALLFNNSLQNLVS